MSEGMKALYGFVGILAAAVIGILWGGYVFSVLWAWFIVTAFGAPAISVAQSIGVLMVVGFAAKPRTVKKDDDSDPGRAIGVSFFLPLLFLVIGWIVKQWLPA